jgi:hypothetical protein
MIIHKKGAESKPAAVKKEGAALTRAAAVFILDGIILSG